MVRSGKELDLMRQSGKITALALKKVLENVKPGISLTELNKIAEDKIKSLGGESSFKTVPGYYWTTCLTVNEEVVHGMPRGIKLNKGDVLNVDLGAVYQGWHTDTAWTVVVGEELEKMSSEKRKFLEIGEKVMWQAIDQARAGKKIGDISSTIQEGVEGAGYSVVKSLAGHGVGRSVHEEPEIPEYGEAGKGPTLKEGMTLAVEVIYTEGKGDVYQKEDGWTVASLDGSLGGLFEMTAIVKKGQPEVITDWRKV